MSLTVADLVADLGVNDHGFNSKLAGLMDRFGPFGAVGGAAVASIGAAFIAAGIAAVHFGGEFDDAFDRIRQGTGATGKALAGLENDFRSVVTSVPTDFASASDAVTELHQRLGLAGKPLQALAEQELQLAKITGSDLSENIQLSTRMFGDWSIASKDQAKALDEVFRAGQQTGIGVGDLMSTVVQFGAPLRNLGFGFGDSIAMLSKWEKEGVNVDTVLAGLRYSLKTFAKEGIEPQKGLAKVMEQIEKAPSRGAAMKIGSGVFGLRAASDMVAAIREGRFQYDDLMKSITHGSDTISKAETSTRDWQESLTLLKNNALVMLEPVLDKAFGAVSSLSAELVTAFQSKTGKRIFGDIGQGVSDVLGVIRAAAPTIKRLMSLWFEYFAPATAIPYQIVKHWRTIGPPIMLVLSEVGKDLKAWGGWLVAFGKVIAAAVKVIVKGFSIIAPYVKAALTPALVAIKAFAKVALDVLVVFLRVLRGDWGGAWSALKNLVSDALHGMVSVARAQVSALGTVLKGIGKLALAAVAGFGNLLYSAGKALLQGLINGVKSMVGAAANAVKSAAESVKHAVTGVFGIHSPSAVFHGYGQQLMAGLALGIGDSKGLVHAALGDLSRGMRLPSLGAPGMALAGGGGLTIHGDVNVSLEGSFDDPVDAGHTAAEALVQRARELARGY